VRNQGDAWTRWVDMFRRAFEGLVTAPDERPPNFSQTLADFLPLAERLGARTADMHRAFARPTDDPAFAREELAPADLAHMAQEAREDAAKAFAAIARLRDPSQETFDLAARVLAMGSQIEAAIADFTRDPARGPKIRVHGDYHLGQILIVQHDVRIVDFEGEPARAPEARFAKDTPWRDVAGMMRSIAYAADSAILGIEERLLTKRARAQELGAAGGAFVAQAFLAAYEAALGQSPLAAPQGEARRLLGLKLLAKALYEVHYEAQFRPQWIGIPLRGVLQMIEGTGPHA